MKTSAVILAIVMAAIVLTCAVIDDRKIRRENQDAVARYFRELQEKHNRENRRQ